MRTCRYCGEENLQRARFCMGCSRSLTTSTRSEEIRRVTVLFADIVRSTALISGADPEQARDLLARTVQRFRPAIRHFGGSVISVAGDGFKALFGAPLALEGHALHACLAALRMQAEMSQTAAAADGRQDEAIRIRIGINTGVVLLCSVQSDLHVEYSAEGETTHIAAKAQQAADPGTVLVTAEVARLVQGFVETRPHEPLHIPGLPEPVPVFELLRVTGAQSRFEVAVGRGLTRFIGRDAEIARLDRAAQRAERGEFALIGVIGEAGVGKSRLLWEFRQRLAGLGWALFGAHGTLSGTVVAFHPILTVLRAMYEIDAGDDAAAARHKLRHGSAQAPQLDLPPLLVLLGLPPADPQWDALELQQRRDRTQAAIIAAVLAETTRRPTAVFIDDLNEADAETCALIELMLRRVRDARLLLLLEYRPEPNLDLERLQGFEAVHVQPLDLPHACALFDELAGTDPSLDRLRTRLADHVAGNPLFIEEGVRVLRESGVLSGAAGAFRATAGQHELPISGSVMDVLESRIARLPPEARDLLQIAAVVGKDLRLQILVGLTGLGVETLVARLEGLVAYGLLRANDEGTGEFAFKHALTQDVAYRIMTRSERQIMHARVVDLLESQALDSLPERIELLAHHAVRAEDWDRAVDYLQKAAQRASERSALREVVRLLDHALAILPQLAPERRTADLEIDLLLAMSWPLVLLGKIARAGDEVRRLEALAPACVDPLRQGRLAVFVSGQRWLSGEHALAVEAGRRGIELAIRHDAFSLLVPARQYVGGALHELGEFAESEVLLSANVETVPELTPGHPFGMGGLPAVFCRATRAWLCVHLGRFREAQSDAAEALRIARAAGHGFSIMSATFSMGVLCLERRDFRRAVPLLEEGLALCASERQWMWLPVLGSMQALALTEQGQTDAARALIDKSVPRLDDNVRLSSYMVLTIARVYAEIGRLDAATELADATLARACRIGARTWEAEGLLLRGEIAERGDRLDLDLQKASAAYSAGLELASRLGMRPLAAKCRVGLASAGANTATEAAEQLRLATDEFAALDLPVWSRRPRSLDDRAETKG